MESLQKGRAAEGQTARPDPTPHLGLIPRSDLAHFDAQRVFQGQIRHQPAIVDPALGSVVDSVFTAVEALLGSNQLHRHSSFAGHLGDVLKELLFPGSLGVVAGQIDVRCRSHQFPGVLQLALFDDQGTQGHDLGILEPLVAFDNDTLPLREGRSLRIAEDNPAIFVLIDPDADVVASGIESVSARTTAATGHDPLQSPYDSTVYPSLPAEAAHPALCP